MDPGATTIAMITVYNKEDECSIGSSDPFDAMGTMFFTHKEAATLNGKACFKDYNSTDDVKYWADAEGNPLAQEYVDEEKETRTFITIAAQETPFPRETFVLPQGYKCAEKPEIFEPPSAEAYAAACPATTPSSSMGAAGIHKLSALAALFALAIAVLLL